MQEGKPFKDGTCAMCKLPMLIRPDNLPICSECESKVLAEVAQRFPHIAKGKKLVLHSRAVGGSGES